MRRRSITLSLVLMAMPATPSSAAVGAGVQSAMTTATATATATGTATGNVLVLLDRRRAAAAEGRSEVRAVMARVGGAPAGRSVPEIGLVTLRPPAGVPPVAFARTLRGLHGVVSATVEHRHVPRLMPNDPALPALDPTTGILQWTLWGENFPAAWDLSRGDGALVGVVDTGVDATHPELASKIAGAVDQQSAGGRGTARTDEVGHGTHVASLLCAATNNGIGLAGAGYNCKLVVEKSDFSDSSIASAIVDATERHVQAMNLSFGPSQPQPQSNSASPAEVRALSFAAARHVVLVAAAADDPGSEQGDPANVLQPAGTGPDLNAGLGLDVTAADSSGHRAAFAGFGSEISLAAFAALSPGAGGPSGSAPPGIFGAFPAGPTELEAPPSPCQCRTTFGASTSYAYLQGTSMAAPQVAAAAALIRVMNPDATVTDIITTLKRTASRPSGTGWTNDVGWGILNAGAALEASRRIDHLPPVSRALAPALARRRSFVLRWSGHDQRRPELIPSGISFYEVYVSLGHRRPRRLTRTSRHTLRFRGRPGARYVFFTVAVDRAGNREPHPVDVATRVARTAR